MNLETILDERLWRSIQSFYEDRNFTGAILDAIYFMSDLIREKTGLESDGVTLVGQAFGGKAPKLKVNALQTDSDKNIQAGVEHMLRGLFRAIRNPRSHEKYTDDQKDADAIIIFVNYLLGVIDKSKAPFTKTEFLNRVFDPNFVKKERYAELLVKEIPPKQRLEVMLDIFRKKETGDGEKLRVFVSALLPKLTGAQQKDLFEVVSEELKTTNQDSSIRFALQIFPNDILTKLDETARLRLENRLIESISQGYYDIDTQRCSRGALGTWAQDCCSYFLLRDDLENALVQLVRSEDPRQHEYLFRFFWKKLVELVNPPSDILVSYLKSKIRGGNKQFHQKLYLEREYGDREWVKPFEKEINEFNALELAFDIPEDDIPF